jgi:hypothetical protein
VIDVFCRSVKADQSLARSGNPGHEADGLLRAGLRRRDDGRNGVCGLAKIGGARVAARDLGDRMPTIERQRRFDDGRSWLVATLLPLIDPNPRLLYEAHNTIDRLRQTFGVSQRDVE